MRYNGYAIALAQQERGWIATISRVDGAPVRCGRFSHEFYRTMLCQTRELAEAHARGAIDGGVVT